MSEEISTNDRELYTLEKFAVMQALYKASAAAVDTKTTGNLRDEANHELFDLYNKTGADRVKLSIGGENVGSLSLCFSKPHAEITNQKLYDEWLVTNQLATVGLELIPDRIPVTDFAELAKEHPEWFERRVEPNSRVLEYMDDSGDGNAYYIPTGEVVPGVIWISEQPTGQTRASVKPEKVFDILQRAGLGFRNISGLIESD